MDLAEKHRPKTLDEVQNQEGTISSLRSVLKRPKESLPHAFLFMGSHGCGKTTLAYIVAYELGLEDGDLNINYYNTSNTRGIDTIRDLDSTCRFRPLTKEGKGAIKFYILDECHELTPSAQNALLALLEKPPEHAYFALCTTEPGKLIDTIRSRCHGYTLNSFNRIKIVALLKDICKKEGVEFPADILKTIADSSENSARKALKILDQVIDIPDDDEVRAAIPKAAVDIAEVIDICRIMLDNNSTSWPDLCSIVRSIDAKPDEIRRGILGYLGHVAASSKTFDRNLIAKAMCFTEPITYSGIGALWVQIGLAFQVK